MLEGYERVHYELKDNHQARAQIGMSRHSSKINQNAAFGDFFYIWGDSCCIYHFGVKIIFEMQHFKPFQDCGDFPRGGSPNSTDSNDEITIVRRNSGAVQYVAERLSVILCLNWHF